MKTKIIKKKTKKEFSPCPFSCFQRIQVFFFVSTEKKREAFVLFFV